MKTYSLAEDLLVRAILNGLSNLGICCIRSNNTVLSGHLRLGLFSEIGLNLLVSCDGCLQATFNFSNLGGVTWASGFWHLLDRLDSVDQVTIKALRLVGKVFDFFSEGIFTSRVDIAEQTAVEGAKLVNISVYIIDSTVNISALV